MRIFLFILYFLFISLVGFSDCYLFGSWYDPEEIACNCISSLFPGESLCCFIGCSIPVLLSPLIPDYHILIFDSVLYHGMGWKVPFGITFLDSGYNWYPGFYLLHPRAILTEDYDGFEYFNALRLEFLPEIIFTNAEHDILFGASGRLYIPASAYVSLHAEGGFLVSGQLFIPHAGGGISIYVDLNEISENMLMYIQIAPKILFLPDDEIGTDIQISIKYVFF